MLEGLIVVVALNRSSFKLGSVWASYDLATELHTSSVVYRPDCGGGDSVYRDIKLVLAFSRIGAPYVMGAFWLSLFIGIGTWRTYTTKPLLTDSLIIIAAGLSLYTPSLYLVSSYWYACSGDSTKKQLYILPRKHQWLLPLLMLVVTTPLIYAGIRNINIVEQLLTIDSLPLNFQEFASRVFQNVSQVFFRGHD